MVKVEITIQDFKWPTVSCIINRGNMVQQFDLHYEKAAQALAIAASGATERAVEELLQRHGIINKQQKQKEKTQ